MSSKLLHIQCPEYKFDENLNLKKAGQCIDAALIDSFVNKNVVLRGIQSGKHEIPKDKIIEQILKTGSDRFESENSNEVKVSDIDIDLFGLACKIAGSISLPILDGFHKWKPKCLERPQRRLDIWMIYDANQLENVEYFHNHYKVMAHDGYVFKDPKHKTKALLGVLVID